jgi:hypothetical protein
VLENHDLSEVIGNAVMPYFNSLASQYSLAGNFFANAHPSIGDYFMLTTGQLITSNAAFTGIVKDDNVVRALVGAGKTWKGYMESIPSAGYTGLGPYPYAKHHDPFVYFSDVLGSSTQAANVVPLTQLAADLNSNSLPNYAFLVPNQEHNGHDCPNGGTNCTDAAKLAAADNWLKVNIDPLVQNSVFANTVLVITWDEGNLGDHTHGGGHIAVVVAGGTVKRGFRSTTFYQHESVLRLALDLLNVSDHPGASNGATAMTEFFP